MTTDEEPTARIDLAREPDFALGALQVSPSGCRIHAEGHDERVEPRVMEVLVALARAHGATVTRDQLVDICWGGRIVSEDAITRVIAKVRNLARAIEPAPFALETIPKVGFRLVAADPPPRAAPTPPPPPDATPLARAPWWRSRWSVWAAAAAALAILVAGGFAFWTLRPQPAQSSRIEVMAFEARSADPAIQRMAVSTGESLVRILSSAGAEIAPQVGRPGEGVGPAVFRIAGSLDRQGEGYVANAQFLDRRTGVVLWSARIERPTPDIRGFDEEVALTVAGPVQCALEDRRRFKRPMTPAVFTLYLNACDAISRQGNPQRMLAATRQVVDAAPGEPTAHAMYAIAQAHVANFKDFAPEAELEALRRAARASAERAIRLDPDTPKAYLARAITYPAGSNWAIRERDFRRVQEIDPAMGPGRPPLILVLREVGRLREGLEAAQLATQLADPRMSGGAGAFAVFLAAQTGDLEKARDLIAGMREANPDTDGVEFTVGLWWEPDLATAREIVRRTHQRSSGPSLACAEAHLQNVAQARAGSVVRGLPPACGASVTADWRIRMLARQGDVDGAYAEYFRGIPNSRRSTMLLFYPEMKAFRADPRFMPLAARLGLVDYWRTTGRWPDFCAEPDLPYDCKAVARTLAALPGQPPK